MKTTKSIGTRLRIMRVLHELSLRQLAEAVKIPHSTLCRIENGSHKISFENMIRLSDYYDSISLTAFAQNYAVRNKAGSLI